MDEQIDSLLARLEQNPKDPPLLAEIVRLYVNPDVTAAQRDYIRARIAARPSAYAAFSQWGAAVPDSDPVRYLRLRLLVIALTDGMPDLHASARLIEDLVKDAHRRNIDPEPHIQYVRRLASESVAFILERRMIAWQQTRRFVDGQITVLLESVKRKPRDGESLESLVDIDLHPDTTAEQRLRIRKMVTTKPQIVEGFRDWRPRCKDADPERFYRLSLASISITDAQPDWQGAINRVIELRQFARKNGVDPEPHVNQISGMSAQRTAQVLRRQRL